MAINEFRWGVRPAIPDHWRGTRTHSGFEVEIACEWIEVRKKEQGQRDIQQALARQIVEGLVRSIGLAEKTRFTATLDSVSLAKTISGRTSVGMSGTRSTREGCARHASSDGLKPSAYRAPAGRRIRCGIRNEGAPTMLPLHDKRQRLNRRHTLGPRLGSFELCSQAEESCIFAKTR